MENSLNDHIPDLDIETLNKIKSILKKFFPDPIIELCDDDEGETPIEISNDDNLLIEITPNAPSFDPRKEAVMLGSLSLANNLKLTVVAAKKRRQTSYFETPPKRIQQNKKQRRSSFSDKEINKKHDIGNQGKSLMLN